MGTIQLDGMWLGTYWQDGEPTRFEMTIVAANGRLQGNILDDGRFGEASMGGEIIGRRVQFFKRYLAGGYPPIYYRGLLSENGDYLNGEWSIGSFCQGLWEAYRQDDDLMLKLQKVRSQRVPASLSV